MLPVNAEDIAACNEALSTDDYYIKQEYKTIRLLLL